MPREIELKLELPSTIAAGVPRLRWLRRLQRGPTQRAKLRSVYFDTPQFDLRDHGLTIRVRRSGRQRVQTVKAVATGDGEAYARDEWEHEIRAETPDLDLVKDTALGPLLTKKLRRGLKPVFETVVQRETLPLRCGGAELELAIDRGHILARGKRHRRRGARGPHAREPISEIEIEVERGNPTELWRIAKRLARALPVAYGPQSKAERGYALAANQAQWPVHARSLRLNTHLSSADAFQVIGLSCLDHALANERAVRAGDTEGIHQMRVGLRRLRAALSIFKELVAGPEVEAVKTELKWLAGELAPARALDVLIAKRVEPLRGAAPVAVEAGVLERDLSAQRDRGLERARAAITGERFRLLGLRTALWLTEGAWLRRGNALNAARRQRPACEFAIETLRRRRKKILKRSRRVRELDGHGRHKLRIAVKKLRYATEFFGAMFSGAKSAARRKRFGKALKKLQNALGTLNDMEVHKKLAKSVARARTPSRAQPRKALAMGYITGQEQNKFDTCVDDVEQTAERVAETPKFWK